MIIRVQFEFNNMLVSVNSGEQVSDLILIKLSSHDTMNLQDSCDHRICWKLRQLMSHYMLEF
jgi:hypothetical protein